DLKGKKKDNLQAFIPNLEMSRKLVTLDRHVPVAVEWDKWRVQPWDGPKLLELFRDWGVRGFADQVRSTIQAAPPEKKMRVSQGSLFEGGDDAVAESDGADWPEPHTYHLVNNAADFAAFLAKLNKQRRFAIDLETTSLDPHQAEIVGLAV